MMMGNWLNIMTQAPYMEDKANLPNGIYIMRMYTELKDGSQNVAVVVCNMTAHQVCQQGTGLSKKTLLLWNQN